jgi:hypothetical protein
VTGVDSLTWTDERGPIPAGVGVGRGCGVVTGTVLGGATALVLCVGLGLSWWWAVVSWLAAFSLGSTVARGMARMVVYRIELTRTEVRLVRARSTRTVPVAAVTDIDVVHSVDDEHTTVQLTCARSVAVTTVAVTNRFDPTVAGRLAEVLGPGVRIQETHTVRGS